MKAVNLTSVTRSLAVLSLKPIQVAGIAKRSPKLTQVTCSARRVSRQTSRAQPWEWKQSSRDGAVGGNAQTFSRRDQAATDPQGDRRSGSNRNNWEDFEERDDNNEDGYRNPRSQVSTYCFVLNAFDR